MYDIIIVGAGTAGLTAAIYGVRAGKSVLVLEAKTYGGQIINTPKIENYPGIKEISGFEYAKNLYEQAKDLGAEIRFEQVTAIETAESGKLVKTTKDSYECRSVILATGAKNRPLSLPREQELIGAGVSYCATCDGMFYKDKEIAVLCNDPKYEHEVEYLADLAAKVTYFPMFSDSQIKKENVTISKDFPLEIKGSDRVTGIVLKSGKVLELDGIFCLRNAIAPSKLVSGLEIENGHIKVDRTQKTNLPGCFAAGDCTGRPYQYTKAVGEGNVAAHSCISYLTE